MKNSRPSLIVANTFGLRLVTAIQSSNIRSRDFLGTWNIHDENGCNVAEGLREFGKVYRSCFLLRYLIDANLQQEIRDGCNRAEFWNMFQDAVFWGRKGVISSNNPLQHQKSALFLMLIMNAIVFYNRSVLWNQINNELGNSLIHPTFWQHINFIGRYRIH